MATPFDLDDLLAFRAVAELRNFRRAAEAVHISQPAFSRRIDKLEQALGARLLERTTRHVSLTATGHEFARKVVQWLDDLDTTLLALRGMAPARLGEVTVACIPTTVYYYVSQAIRRYRERYPRIRVRIRDAGAAEVLALVSRGEADFGINFLGSQEPDIDFAPLVEERFVAACRREHPLARRRRVTWSELAAFDVISVSRSSGNRVLLDQALARVAVRPEPTYEAEHVATLLGLVEAGLGVAAVPALAMPGKGHPTLVSVPLEEPAVQRQVGLIRKRGRALTPVAQQLYDVFGDLRGAPRTRHPAAPRGVSGRTRRV
jgi:DNA-binding transcriptional LysR family regulator